MEKRWWVLMGVALVALFLTACGGETCRVVYTRNIRALVDSERTEGSFFLGTGQVQGEHVYRFIEEVKDDVYYARTVPAAQVLVYEYADADDDRSAWVVYLEDNGPEYHGCVPEDTLSDYVEEWYEIHVPKGAIVPLVEVDLQ